MGKFNISEATPCEDTPIGEYIKDEMHAREISPEELSFKTGIYMGRMTKILENEVEPTSFEIVTICKVFNIYPDIYIGLKKNKHN